MSAGGRARRRRGRGTLAGASDGSASPAPADRRARSKACCSAPPPRARRRSRARCAAIATCCCTRGDARRAGRALSRAELREFAGELDDQMVLWELVADGQAATVDLALDDLDWIGSVARRLRATARHPDAKLARLRALLADRRPTLVFTTRRETVRHLRDRLGAVPVAWCTGDRAGLGHAPVPRAVGAGMVSGPPEPATRCRRLPGRHRRRRRGARPAAGGAGGALRPAVDPDATGAAGGTRRAARLARMLASRWCVSARRPPSSDASRLGERLARKAALPGPGRTGRRTACGSGAGARRWPTSWATRRAWVAPRWRVEPGRAGCRSAGLLAGFDGTPRRRTRAPRRGGRLAGPGTGWTEERRPSATGCRSRSRRDGDSDTCRHGFRQAVDSWSGPIRARLVAGGRAALGGSRARAPPPGAVADRLGDAVAGGGAAARRRTLARLERALGFVAGGHTAGEAMLIRTGWRRRLSRAAGGWAERMPAPAPRWGRDRGAAHGPHRVRAS